MSARIVGYGLVLLGALGLSQGCVEKRVVQVAADDDGAGGGGATKGPGERCSCDADCGGAEALCLLGMCAQRASGLCSGEASELECAPGFKCLNSDIVAGSGVCFPVYDAATCEGVENRLGLCSPVRGDICDASCGSACVADGVAEGAPGSACTTDPQCQGFNATATCYADAVPTDPSGWVGGYCMAFGCTSDAECGDTQQSGCVPAASDGSGVCMNRCSWDLDCRAGYRCRYWEGGGSACFAGCDAAATCPTGFSCTGNVCVDDTVVCSPQNLTGFCPEGSWCDAGVCNDTPFACNGSDDTLEPNDTRQTAKAVPAGTTGGLALCAGNEDWYEVTVPAGKIVRVGVEFQHGAGDLDLVAYEADGALLGSRLGKVYPYNFRDQETGSEYYGFYSKNGGDKYYLRVVGYGSPTAAVAENNYTLHHDEYDYVDGADCQAAGWTFEECAGIGPAGSGLLPFPFPDPNDGTVGREYLFDTYSNYRFARREMVMLVRNALLETEKAFPGTAPLGVIDICQIDGVTPGYDVGDPRHPETTHDQGGNVDLAYFQTDGDNSSEIICGDGSVHGDGFCSEAATSMHKVDLPRQAFFMAQLFKTNRTRVIGVDTIIAPLILEAAKALNELPEENPQHISNAQLARFGNGMAYGSGWPFHHHHIHLSLQWWSSSAAHQGTEASWPDDPNAERAHFMHRTDISPHLLHNLASEAPAMAWPPLPAEARSR